MAATSDALRYKKYAFLAKVTKEYPLHTLIEVITKNIPLSYEVTQSLCDQMGKNIVVRRNFYLIILINQIKSKETALEILKELSINEKKNVWKVLREFLDRLHRPEEELTPKNFLTRLTTVSHSCDFAHRLFLALNDIAPIQPHVRRRLAASAATAAPPLAAAPRTSSDLVSASAAATVSPLAAVPRTSSNLVSHSTHACLSLSRAHPLPRTIAEEESVFLRWQNTLNNFVPAVPPAAILGHPQREIHAGHTSGSASSPAAPAAIPATAASAGACDVVPGSHGSAINQTSGPLPSARRRYEFSDLLLAASVAKRHFDKTRRGLETPADEAPRKKGKHGAAA